MEQIRKFLKNKSILVTGSCGSVGSSIIKYLLEKTECKKVVSLDNNEGELFFQRDKYKNFKNFYVSLVDICDLQSVNKSLMGIDYVLHCAALKNVPICEISPSSCINVNVIGTSNIIEASISNNVKKVIFTSSDKAVSPTNVMGASKLVAEKIITAANIETSNKFKTVFSSTRFGNVIGSTGSVLPIFQNQINNNKKLTVTSKSMTRFMMSNIKSVELVLSSLVLAKGGEIFITKMPSINVYTFAKCVYEIFTNKKSDDTNFEIIGLRQGEKMYEELMYQEELSRSYEIKDFFIVLPNLEIYNELSKKKKFKKYKKIKKVYNSDIENQLSYEKTKSFLKKIILDNY